MRTVPMRPVPAQTIQKLQAEIAAATDAKLILNGATTNETIRLDEQNLSDLKKIVSNHGLRQIDVHIKLAVLGTVTFTQDGKETARFDVFRDDVLGWDEFYFNLDSDILSQIMHHQRAN